MEDVEQVFVPQATAPQERLHAVQGADLRLLRCRQRLEYVKLAAFRIEQREIGEGAADIKTEFKGHASPQARGRGYLWLMRGSSWA